jgi:hypothetical protein
MTWRWTWMRHSKRVASEKVNERRWINVIESHAPDIERLIKKGHSRSSIMFSPGLLSVEYPYDCCTISCFTTPCELRFTQNCFTVTTLQRQSISGSRQSGSCNQTIISTVPSFSGRVIIQSQLMDQSASFSTGGVATEARRQLLGDLLPTVGYTSYKHSTMKSL